MKPRGYRKQPPDSECIKSEERTESVCREQRLRIYEQKTHRVGNLSMWRRDEAGSCLECPNTTRRQKLPRQSSRPIIPQPPENSLAGCFEELRPSAPTCIVVTRKTRCSGTATPRAEVQALTLFARVAVNASETATVLTDFHVEHRDGISAFSQKMASEEYYCISCQHWLPSLSRGQEKKKTMPKRLKFSLY